MNTKTMRLPPRRVLTSNKRKECEGYDSLKPSSPTLPASSSLLPTTTTKTKLAKPVAPPQAKKIRSEPEPASSNQLLAGYLAHEYINKGTLFGQPWDPTKPQAAESNKRIKVSQSQKSRETEPSKVNYERYVEVSNLLMREEGAHVAGVYNPSQLARFLQM
ncbi:uncharacterized protein [Euphorbia lathyris]|uniref:uncharacterized protein n=1 Tax=Euphorbia lathyris TaxID=212925 RepID=UPI003313E757